jgi:hypothetical protein
VRPPHGRAPALTAHPATVRLLRYAFLLTVLVLALAAAGCGSDAAEVEEGQGLRIRLHRGAIRASVLSRETE